MPPRKLYVSFVQGFTFGWSIVPLLGPLNEYALRQITLAIEKQLPTGKPVTIISITTLEDD